MINENTTYGRRSFLKTTALAGGGMLIGMNWLFSCSSEDKGVVTMPDEWYEMNGYLKIGNNGVVTIFAPNPEFGQNVKTSMPMLVAEELDVEWKNVLVEQAPYNPNIYTHTRQFTGGSMGILMAWEGLRQAGAAARLMLRQAAASEWKVPVEEVRAEKGMLTHQGTGRAAGYGDMAAAASKLEVPAEIPLKTPEEFSIIGTSTRNVEGEKIVTGAPLFAMDLQREGMLYAMLLHPPAFGMRLKSVDDSAARAMPGIREVFTLKVLDDDYERQPFDVVTFTEVVAVVGHSTWEVMNARKTIQAVWEEAPERTEHFLGWGGEKNPVTVPGGLESSDLHLRRMEEMAARPGKLLRKDGNPESVFKSAAKVIERTFTAPFLAHNCMEPMNFFADVTGEKIELAGPLQGPGLIEHTVATRLGVPVDKIEIKALRMGGGFGRRAYSHYLVEAALISQKVQAPVKLLYSREDDMTAGIYRPAYHAVYRAALDANNKLIAYHVKAGGIPESPLGHAASRFPAGAVDHYLAEEWALPSNITIGAFRAPGSNFLAAAEQSFLDEVAEAAGQDPIEFRLELLDRAAKNPVGENNDYEPERYAGVLKLVKEKSGWGTSDSKKHRGVSAYFCHRTYVAQVLEVEVVQGTPRVQEVCCAIDCGIVVNPDAAANMAEGAIVDGIGNALYGAMTFQQGKPDKTNFDKYRMIRMPEAPKKIDVHFVQNTIAPTGMGEPPFPPVFAALANALYKANGKRVYHQPFLGDRPNLG